jgi:sec-independent protein translocase protein TatA
MGASLVSPTHLVLLAIACLLLFGAKRLPEIGRSLGSGMREFKDSVTTGGSDGMDATRSHLPPSLPVAEAPVAVTFAAPAETTPAAPVAAGSERDVEPAS